MTFEVGQLWKTRGGWHARIVAKVNYPDPILVIHDVRSLEIGYAEYPQSHETDGSLYKTFKGPSNWDLLEKIEET